MDLKKLIAQPKTFGAVLKMNLDKPARWVLVLHGPKDSIYEGQNFHATIQFPREYPLAPPSITF